MFRRFTKISIVKSIQIIKNELNVHYYEKYIKSFVETFPKN